LLTAANSLDIGANGTTLGWARSFRIVNTSGSDGTDGGAFGATGNGTTPQFVFMAIPTASSPTGYTSNKIIALDNLGNVGIGTTGPASRLDIKSSAASNLGGLILRSTSSSTKHVSDLYEGTLGQGTLDMYDGSNNVNTRIIGNGVSYFNGGYVGIGTTHPDQPLTVNGQIHSTEVMVTSTVPTPDYVFNSSYYLRPLADVKAFVDKNHHLPEVPSAAEFKKDGQNLGEMNMLLLKKVEELTLYMIEQNKKTAELEKIVKAQQEEIERLKNSSAGKN